MKYLRAIKGITLRYKIRNEVIREDLNVESILESIERKQLKWFGQTARMEDKRHTKRVLKAKSTGKRGRGRPRRTWGSTIADILKKSSLTWKV